MPEIFTDQLGRKVCLGQWPPRRIVSLVPSQTEFLADLGLAEEVLGITKFCVRPEGWFQQKNRVGGTKTLDFQKIEALMPDLLIGNKEENEQAQIEQLSQKFPVWMSDVRSLGDALEMLHKLGEVTGKTGKAGEIAAAVGEQFARHLPPVANIAKAAYLIWRKPYMAAGRGTFIDDMLRCAGFENVFADLLRYPEITAKQLAKAEPEAVLLSSEPYPFAQKHIAEIQEVCPRAVVQLVDGELFSWYGSRLLQAPAYFARLREKWQ